MTNDDRDDPHDPNGVRAWMIKKVNEGVTVDEFIKTFNCNSRATARLYMYKIRKGLISMAPLNREPRIGRRGRALIMFADGRSLDEVIAATGLKRATARQYHWEQRRMAAHEAFNSKSNEPEPRDPLCE